MPELVDTVAATPVKREDRTAVAECEFVPYPFPFWAPCTFLQPSAWNERMSPEIPPTPRHPHLMDWVSQSKRGDPRAFRKIVDTLGPHILADCRQILGSPEDARDRSQEVFTKAFFKLRSIRDDAAFEGWLKRLKVNHCLSAVRGFKVREVEFDEDRPESGVTDAWDPLELDRESVREAVERTMSELSDTSRIVLVMHDMDGLSYSEIAKALGIGVSAAKMRVQRARSDFRRVYTDFAPDEYEGGR